MGLVEFDKVAVLTAFFGSVIFLAGYSLIAPWWTVPAGRAMASLDVALILALAPSALHVLIGFSFFESQVFAWYTAASIMLVGLITLWRLVVIWRIQVHEVRRAQRSRES